MQHFFFREPKKAALRRKKRNKWTVEIEDTGSLTDLGTKGLMRKDREKRGVYAGEYGVVLLVWPGEGGIIAPRLIRGALPELALARVPGYAER